MPASDPYWRVKELFVEALDKRAGEEREAFLRGACGDDAELLLRINEMLGAHARASAVLPPPGAAPAVGLAATLHSDTVAAAASERAGELIGPYKLLERIGEGGMGAVWMAEQREPIRRTVALKLIKLGMDTRSVIARFEAERQALALMDHPNIARVFDAGSTDTGRPYFVMELVKGEPVTQYCDEHRLDVRQRLGLFAQVCGAVQHAHQKGLIHRDIKPSNVLVATHDGDRPLAKVIDFGIAKATQARLTEKTLFTEFRQLIGTPEYMSPEQAVGDLDIDTRSDVYALGVLLYELLVGATPFDGRELRSKAYAEMQRIIREVEPPRPSTRLSSLATLPAVAARRGTEPARLSASVRGELDWIVMKCLEKDRTRRYATANGLAADVQRYLADEPISAAAPSRAYRLRKFVRRNKTAVVISLAMVLLLLGGTVGTTVGLIGQYRQRAIAERNADIADALYRFQGEMLFAVDPSQMRGKDVTVMEVIQAAVKELDAGKLKDQPLVEAGIRETIGSAFRSLGRFIEAEPQHRKALELRRAALPPNDPAIAGTLFELALVTRAQGRFAEAEGLYREALAIGRQSFPAADKRIFQIMANLADVLRVVGRFDEAEATAREGLAKARESVPSEDPMLGDAISALAIVLHSRGKMAEAEPLFRESVGIKRKALSPDHPELALRLDDLATAITAQGKFSEAEPIYLEALQIRRKALPPLHPQLAQNLNNLGLLYQYMGKLTDAQQLCSEAVSIYRQTLRPDDPELGMFLNNLGLLLQRQGQLDQAEQVLREAWGILRKMPSGTEQPAIVAANLAALLVARSAAAEAEPLFREALVALRSGGGKSGREPWKEAVMREGLGRALTALGRLDEAEAELLAAEPVLAAGPTLARGSHARCIGGLIDLYVALHRSHPDKGYDAKAAKWRAELPSTQPSTTSPATFPATEHAAPR